MPVLLVIAFLVVPLAELAVVIEVGSVIGTWPTGGLLLAMSLLGAWIVRREGRRAWRGLREAVSAGRVPGREAADAALILVGGTLLLTPGFLTDVFGLLLVLPPTRAVPRRALFAYVTRRVVVLGGPSSRRGRRPHRVVPGEVLDPPEKR